MNLIPLDLSIVVVGQDCNPTILNPDFLKYREIVPEAWGWELSGPAITTPALAIVPYNSGVTVKVEPNRFQVTDQQTAAAVSQSKIIEIARRYIDVLPHVRYTAVGINFRRLVQMNEPDAFLKQRFLKAGSWDREERQLRGITLKLVYPYDNGQLILSLEGSALVRQTGDQAEQVQGVLAHANFHRDCKGYPTDRLVLEHIAKATTDETHLGALLTELLSDVAE